jgi:LIM domain-binding protein 1
VLQESDNLWWDAFATEFFEDEATLTLTFCLEDGPKRYSKYAVNRIVNALFSFLLYLSWEGFKWVGSERGSYLTVYRFPSSYDKILCPFIMRSFVIILFTEYYIGVNKLRIMIWWGM